MKKVIKKIVSRLWPELVAGYHLPLLAIVKDIACPPKNGEEFSFETPYYAVDVQMLRSDLSEDTEMPLIRDVPVCFPAAAPSRGFVGLPQPGTIVELAFAFGMQDKPFIRSVLPYSLQLPAIDDKSQRWQQSATSFQEVDADGNWNRETDQNIADHAGKNIKREATENITEKAGINWTRETLFKTSERSGVEHEIKAPLVYIGNDSNNLLRLCSEHMTQLIALCATLATHTHKYPNGVTESPIQADAINQINSLTAEVKALLDIFTK